MYNLQSDGSWQVEKFVAADDMVKKVQEVMGKSSAVLKKYADAVLVGEKDGLLEIKLLPRAEAGLPDLSGLTEDKGILELQQSMRNYIAAPNAENVEIHLFINSATGELTYMQVDLSRWLKDELQLLNAMPELKAMAGLSQVDLSALDCGMIMSCEYVSLPKDYQVVVPAEIKKNARKLKK